MIRPCNSDDFNRIHFIINEAARAYEGVIPEDRWKEPYMSEEELRREIAEGVTFWGYQKRGELVGVMGIQRVGGVTLIRHAYVLPAMQRRGIGGKLLAFLYSQTDTPVLIGTWADAKWAIAFYQKHGFKKVSPEEKDSLLTAYWTIPRRQVETSVVLADLRYFEQSKNTSTTGSN